MQLAMSISARRAIIENEIDAKQQIIDGVMSRMGDMRAELSNLITAATTAIDERDRLIATIFDEKLWQGDYESEEQYEDSRGISRQRSKQIRDRLAFIEAVNSVDAMLPPPSDLHARQLARLGLQEGALVYKTAVEQSGGKAPSTPRLRMLVDAAMDGYDPASKEEIGRYIEKAKVTQIVRLFESLSDFGKREVETAILNRS